MNLRNTMTAAALALALAAPAWAGDLTIPNQFRAGTKAMADEVNVNFDAVEAAVDDNAARTEEHARKLESLDGSARSSSRELEVLRDRIDALRTLLFADTDTTRGGVTRVDDSEVVTNEVKVSVPTDGQLHISGTIILANEDKIDQQFVLKALIDGNPVMPGAQNGVLELDGVADPIATGTVSYNVTIPVTKGDYVVSQVLDPTGRRFSFDGNNLSVLFVPGAASRVIRPPIGKLPLDPRL
jgi:hypothetical protein